MALSDTSRRGGGLNVSKFTFVFFALAVSVFGWGLQYKLSLYEPHVATHTMPAAKLLSRDESEPREGLGLAQERPAGNPLEGLAVAVCAALSLILPNLAGSAAAEFRRALPSLGRPILASLFFRPPPAAIIFAA